MTTEEILNQLGVSLEQARTFILNNVDTPDVIYNIAAQHNIGFEVLAEILDNPSVNADQVKGFFSSHGFDTSSDTPLVSTNDEETPTAPEETLDSSTDFDFSDYEETLASYGIDLDSVSGDSGSSFPASISNYLDSIGGGEFDIDGYIEFFNSVNFDDYIDNIVAGIDLDAIAARYSNMDWGSAYSFAPVAPTGVVDDLPLDLI